MAIHKLVEQFDLPGPDSFHNFLVVQHSAWRFQSDVVSEKRVDFNNSVLSLDV